MAASGIYRYQVDFTRHEIIFYSSSGPSFALSTSEPAFTRAEEFLPDQLQEAFQEAWSNEKAFSSLQETAMKAGCSGYFLQIAPLRVLVYGTRTDWEMIDVIGVEW